MYGRASRFIRILLCNALFIAGSCLFFNFRDFCFQNFEALFLFLEKIEPCESLKDQRKKYARVTYYFFQPSFLFFLFFCKRILIPLYFLAIITIPHVPTLLSQNIKASMTH